MNTTPNYLILDNFLDHEVATKLARRVRNELHWKLHEEWFFSQHDTAWIRREFDRPHVGELSSDISLLVSTGSALIESSLNAVVGRHYTVIVHMMMPGQLVGIHNDSPEQDRGRIENYRLVYYIDDEYQDDKGGHLFLFGSRNETDIIDAVRPVNNSAVLMRLSDSSHHAVSKVQRSVRYSIVASYWGYPILYETQCEINRVRRCLVRIIELGLEEVAHSGTTFANHLYHTFRILRGWNQDIDVCLAGLCHSLLGRATSGIIKTAIARSELMDLVGVRALSLIEMLQLHAGFESHQGINTQVSNNLYLIELANILEQATSSADLDEVAERCMMFPGASCDLRDRINADIAHAREALHLACK